MQRKDPRPPRAALPAGAEMRAVLSELMDRLFVVVATVGTVAVSATVTRALIQGWTVANSGSVAAYVLIMGTLLLRRRLGETVAFWLVVGLAAFDAVLSLARFGLTSCGLLQLATLSIVVCVLLGLRAGLTWFSLSLVVTAIVGAATVAGVLALPHDAEALLRSPATWISHGAAFAAFTVAVVFAAHIVQSRLVRSLAEVRERTQALDEAIGRLRDSERRYRLLAENITDVVFVQDRDLRILYASPSCERLFGYAPQEAERLQLRDLMTPESLERALSLYAGYLERARHAPVDVPLLQFEYVRKDGSRFWGELRVDFVRDEHGAPAGSRGVLRDVTERRQLEEQLRQSEKLQAIGQLAGGVAHDFNNQLAVILSFAEQLGREGAATPRAREAVDSILTAARRSADLTRQLLAFARRGPQRSAPIDLHALLTEVATIVERGVGRRIRVTRRLAEGPCFVAGDASALASAFLNLALNARDAMPEGGELTFATRALAPTGEDGARLLEVRVSDTGSGMDDETRRHMFEPFYTTKDDGLGTGLGLAAVYGTVQSHGGWIDVDSAPGAGTTVSIRLPLVEPPAARSASPPAAPPARERPATLLVVEDEELVCRATSAALEEAGYRVRSFTRPMEAVEHYRDHASEIDAVVLDLLMPDMSGKDMLARLRDRNPDVAVLLVSGYGHEAWGSDLAALGAGRLLEKPFRAAELVAAVEEVLRKAAAA